MMRTAWTLGGLEQYRELNLRRWCHMLGFRGHFLTKSRCYSTTFTAIREERQSYRRAEKLTRLGFGEKSGNVAVVNDWRFTEAGYRGDAESELAAAIAARMRTNRKERYSKEKLA